MDEIEWFGGSDPTRMLEFLHGNANSRKLRLFACACCARIGHLFVNDHDREALGAAERFADGREVQSELAALHTCTTLAALFEATGEDAAGAAAVTSSNFASIWRDRSRIRRLTSALGWRRKAECLGRLFLSRGSNRSGRSALSRATAARHDGSGRGLGRGTATW